MMFDIYSVDYYFTVSADNSAVSDLSEFEDNEETLCQHRSGGDGDRPQALHANISTDRILPGPHGMLQFFFTDIFLEGIV